VLTWICTCVVKRKELDSTEDSESSSTEPKVQVIITDIAQEETYPTLSSP